MRDRNRTSRRDFMKTMAGAGAAAAWGMGTPVHAEENEKGGINVLFLMTDQHHHRCLGAAGNKLIKTPNLDRLASEGVIFTHANCPTPFCSPTRASIVTGLYPHSHGLVRNVQGAEGWLREGMFPITEGILHDAGYATAHFGKWHLGNKGDLECYESMGYPGPGFHEYMNEHCPKEKYTFGEGDATLWGRPVAMVPAIQQGHKKYNAWERRSKQDISVIGRLKISPDCLPEANITRLTLDEIERQKDRNWMITCSWSPPHAEWVCPEPYYSMYDPSKLPMPDNIDNCPERLMGAVGKKLGSMMGPEGIREYIRCYWGQVSYIDMCVGQILAKLEELGLDKKTLVIFTSDHGDMQGRHGVMGKSIPAYYDDILRVPLLMRLPEVIRAKTVVDTQVSTADLMPTILDYVGMPSPEGIHGQDLRPLIEGKEEKRYAFCERTSQQNTWISRMIRGERWKYVYRSGEMERELYDLEKDPRENENRYSDPACKQVMDELHEALREWLIATEDPNRDLLS